MNKRRLAVGIPLAILLGPAMVAGVFYHIVSMYFNSGREIARILNEALDEWLAEKDE